MCNKKINDNAIRSLEFVWALVHSSTGKPVIISSKKEDVISAMSHFACIDDFRFVSYLCKPVTIEDISYCDGSFTMSNARLFKE